MTSATICGPSGSFSVSCRSPWVHAPGDAWHLLEGLGRRGWHEAIVRAVEHERRHGQRRQPRPHAFLRREPEGAQPCRHPLGRARVQQHPPPDLRIARQHVRAPRVLEGERRPDPGDQRGNDVLPARQPVVEGRPRQHEQVRRGPTRQHVVGADQATVRVGEQDNRSTSRPLRRTAASRTAMSSR